MAEDLDPIRQNIDINITEKGADDATKDISKLNTTIESSTTATKKQTEENKKAEEGFKSLKTQLKEAIVLQQKMSAQYGSTSKEAIAATKAVAGIKDEIGFQKDLVESFNPDDKFRKLTQTAGLAALALGGVKDGLATVGIESKILDQVIGTAQSILGVTSALGAMSDAYEVLTVSKKAKSAADVVEIGTTEALVVAETEATAATWSWNSALLANPIVLVTAGIVAAGAAIYAYSRIVGDSVKDEEKAKVASMQLTVELDNQAKAFENNSKYTTANNDHKIALLKASGASEAQIYKETQALKAQEIQLAQNYRNELIRIEERAYQLNKANGTEATEAALKAAQENLKKANDQILKNFNEVDKIRDDHEVAVAQAATDARLKREQAEEAARLKKVEKDKADRLKRIQDAKDLAKSEAQSIIDTNKELEAADTKRQEEIAAKTKEEAERNLSAMQYYADREVEIDKSKAEQKQTIQDSIINIAEKGIQLISSVFGKSKAVQKGAIIAENAIGIGKQVISNNVANAGALATPQAIATSGVSAAPVIALNNISTGIGIAATVAATAKALSAVGGGGAGSAPGTVATPTRNVAQVGFQGSSENQISTAIAQQQKDQPPLQAYVVSQSVTDAQELERKKQLNNSF